jgi:hypothetical protein
MYRYALDRATTPDKEMGTRPHSKAMKLHAYSPFRPSQAPTLGLLIDPFRKNHPDNIEVDRVLTLAMNATNGCIPSGVHVLSAGASVARAAVRETVCP